jgi:hypothetical protein
MCLRKYQHSAVLRADDGWTRIRVKAQDTVLRTHPHAGPMAEAGERARRGTPSVSVNRTRVRHGQGSGIGDRKGPVPRSPARK